MDANVTYDENGEKERARTSWVLLWKTLLAGYILDFPNYTYAQNIFVIIV